MEKQAKKWARRGVLGGRKMGTFFWVAKREKGMEEEEVARRNIAFHHAPPYPKPSQGKYIF